MGGEKWKVEVKVKKEKRKELKSFFSLEVRFKRRMLASSCQRCFRRKIRYGVRRVMMLSSSSSTTTAASRSSTVVAENSASSSSSSGGGLGLFTWYSKTIDAYPLLTKCITAGIVSGAGDLASQKLLKKQQQEAEKGSGGGNDDIDLMQTLRFVSMNVFF